MFDCVLDFVPDALPVNKLFKSIKNDGNTKLQRGTTWLHSYMNVCDVLHIELTADNLCVYVFMCLAAKTVGLTLTLNSMKHTCSNVLENVCEIKK